MWKEVVMDSGCRESPPPGVFRRPEVRAAVVLGLAPFLLITWKVFGDPKVLRQVPAVLVLWDDPAATGAVYSFVACFLLMGVIPALVVKLVFRQSLAEYGVRLGNAKRTFRSMAMLVPPFILGGYLGAQDAGVTAQYPVNPHAGNSLEMFAWHAAAYLLFYLGWEFFFRGFMQFGLRPSMGDANAILVQVLASVLLHIGKPTTECYLSIFGGVLWGVLAFRTRSLLSGLSQHYALGVSLDWFICFWSRR
jgi:uncharacterized protein